MSKTLSHLVLTAALLAPMVTLDWRSPRRRGATTQQTAAIGTESDVIIQGIDPSDDPMDSAHGLSAWSRARGATTDPFPIRLWGFTRQIDGAGWQHLRRTIHHRLLMQAQMQVLLTGKALDDTLCGLTLTDVDAARRIVALVSGRHSQAETLATLLHDLHATA